MNAIARNLRLILAVTFLLVLAACGDDSTEAEPSSLDMMVDFSGAPDAGVDVMTGDVPTDAVTPAEDTGTPDQGQEVMCVSDEMLCEGSCVDVQNSEDHCGDCDSPCDADETCELGICREPAPTCDGVICEGFEYCDPGSGECVEGCDRDEQCEEGEICDAGTHACVCDAGTHDCEGTCVPNTSVNTCGNSCTPCLADNGYTATCDGASCGVECPTPNVECGSACVQCPSAPEIVATGCQADTCVATQCAMGYRLCTSGCCAINSTFETVDGGERRIERNLSAKYDSQDNLHVAYFDWTNGTIRYAFFDGISWSIETVGQTYEPFTSIPQTNGREMRPSLDLDSSDNPHIAYRDDAAGLTYATKSAAGWSLEIVDNSGGFFSGYAGESPALVLDTNDAAHIVYLNEAAALDVQYAYDDGTQWVISGISDGGHPSGFELDPQGTFHVLFKQNSSTEGLRYGTYDGTAWSLETVVSNPGFIFGPYKMTIDSSSDPHVVYHSGSALVYASRTAGTWTTQNVDTDVTGTGFGREVDIEIGGNGDVHVSYVRDGFSRAIGYAVRSGSGWTLEEVLAGNHRGNNLAIDSAGNLTIALVDQSFDSMSVANRGATGWTVDRIDAVEPIVGFQNGLARDSTGTLEALYFDQSNGQIRRAVRMGTNWTVSPVPTDHEPSMVSAPAFDSLDRLHFVYESGRNLYHVVENSGNWTEELISSDVRGISHDAFALDGNDQPHVVYTWRDCFSSQCVGSQVRHSWHDGSQWNQEHVDSLPSTSVSYVRVLIDGANSLHIGTYNSLVDDLHYTWHDGTGFQSSSVHSSVSDGQFGMMLDASGTPYLSYEVGGVLEVSKFDGTIWQADVVDSQNGAGGSSSITEGPTGQIMVSYRAEDTADLRLATFDGSQWTTRDLVTMGATGVNTHLQYDPTFGLEVLFFTPSRGALQYYHEAP